MKENEKLEIARNSKKRHSQIVAALTTLFTAVFIMFISTTGHVYAASDETQDAAFDVVATDYLIRSGGEYQVINGNENITLVSYDENLEVTNHETYSSSDYQVKTHLIRADEIVVSDDTKSATMIWNKNKDNYFLYDEEADQAMVLSDNLSIDETQIPKDSLLSLDSENGSLEVTLADTSRIGDSDSETLELGPDSVITFASGSLTLGEITSESNEMASVDDDDLDIEASVDDDLDAETSVDDDLDTEANVDNDLDNEANVDDNLDNETNIDGSLDTETNVDDNLDTETDVDSTVDVEHAIAIPEQKSVDLDKSEYETGEIVTATLEFTNPDNASISSVTVDGVDYPLTVTANTEGVTTGTIELTTPETVGVNQTIGTIEGFTFNNGTEAEYADTKDMSIQSSISAKTPVLTNVELDNTVYVANSTVILELTFTNEDNSPISSIIVDGEEITFDEKSNEGGTTVGTIEITIPETVGVDQTIGTIEGFTFNNGIEAEYTDTTDMTIQSNVSANTPVLTNVALDNTVYVANSAVILELTFTNENNAPISSIKVDGEEISFVESSNEGGITVGTIEIKTPETVGVDQTIGAIEGFTFNNGIEAVYTDTTDVSIQSNVAANTPVLTNVALDNTVYVANSTVLLELTFTNENNAPISTIKVGGEEITFVEKSNEAGTTVGTIELITPETVGIDQTIGTIEGFTFNNGIEAVYADTTSWPIAEDIVHETVVLTDVSYEDMEYKPGQDVVVSLTFSNPTGATIETIGVNNGTSANQLPLENQQNNEDDGTTTGTITLTAPTNVGADQPIEGVTDFTYHDGVNTGVVGTVTAPSLGIVVDVVHEPVVLTDVAYEDVEYYPGQDVVVTLTFSNPTGATIETIEVYNGKSVELLPLEGQQNKDVDGITTGTITLKAPTEVGADQLIEEISGFTYHDGINPSVAGTATASNQEVIVDVVHMPVVLTDVAYEEVQYLGQDVKVTFTFDNPTGATIETIGVNNGTSVEQLPLEDQQNNEEDGTTTGTITFAAPADVGADQSIGEVTEITYNDGINIGVVGSVTATSLGIVVDVIHEPVVLTDVAYEDVEYNPGQDVVVSLTFSNPTGATIETIGVNSGTSPNQLPSGTSPNQLPSGTSANQLPSGTSANQLPSGTSPSQLPSGTSPNQLPLENQQNNVEDGTTTGTITLTAPENVGADQPLGEVTEVMYHDGINTGVAGKVTAPNQGVVVDVVHEPVVLTDVTYDDVEYNPGQDVVVTLTFSNPTGATIETIEVDNGTSLEQLSLEDQQNNDVDGTTTGTITLTAPAEVGADQSIGEVTEYTYHDGITSDVAGTVTASNLEVIVDVVHAPVVLTDVAYEEVYYPGQDVEVTFTFDNPTGATIESIGVNNGTSVEQLPLEDQQNNVGTGTSSGTLTFAAPTGVGADQIIGTINGVMYNHDNNDATSSVAGTVTEPNQGVVVDVVHEPVVLTDVAYEDVEYNPGQDVVVTLTFSNPTGATIETIEVDNGTSLEQLSLEGQQNNEATGTSTGTLTFMAPVTSGADQLIAEITGFTYHDGVTSGVEGEVTETNLRVVVDVVNEPVVLTDVAYEDVAYTPGQDVVVTLKFSNPSEATIETIEVNNGTSVEFLPLEDQQDGKSSGTITLTAPTAIGANQFIGEVTGFTYHNGITAGVEGTVTAPNTKVITDVGIVPTLDSVTIDEECGAGNVMKVPVKFTNPSAFTIETIKVSGVDKPVIAQTNNADGTSDVTIQLVAPTTSMQNANIGTVEGFTYRFGEEQRYVSLESPIQLEALTYIPIASAKGLQAIDTHPQKGDPNAVFKLVNDIDMPSQGENFTPIDNFGATFDGQGYMISPIQADNGLFESTTSTAVIENVNVVVYLTQINTYNTGGLVGVNYGTIKNCHVTNDGSTYSYIHSNTHTVGGLVGHNFGTIENSSSNTKISGVNNVGGLVGINEGTITGSYCNAPQVKGYDFVGGLVGYDSGKISDCYSTAEVVGVEDVGGLVGYGLDTDIRNSHATGYVEASSGDAGGLVGELHGYIQDSYATGTVVGNGTDNGSTWVTPEIKWCNDCDADHFKNGSNIYKTDPHVGQKPGEGVTDSVGGLVGSLEEGSVSNSYSTSQVNGSGFATGGLVGFQQGGTSISYTYATGHVKGKNNVGGLIGYQDGSVYGYKLGNKACAIGQDLGAIDYGDYYYVGSNDEAPASVTDSYATGTVEAKGQGGGLVGFSFGGKISHCYATGNVHGNQNGGDHNGSRGLCGSSYPIMEHSHAYEYQYVENDKKSDTGCVNGDTAFLHGANAIASEWQMIDPAWQAKYMRSYYTFQAGFQPQLVDKDTGQPLPEQPWNPIRSS